MNPFFEVERKKLHTVWEKSVPDIFGREPWIDRQVIDVGRDVLLNKETGQVVGVVTPKYKFVHNSQLADKIDHMVEQLPVEKVDDHLDIRGSRWQRDILLAGEQFSFLMDRSRIGGDVVKTKISFFNGYDGKTSAGWMIGAWRQICKNGMMGWRKIYGALFPHLTEDIIERFHQLFVEKHIEFGREMSLMQHLSEQDMTRNEFITFLLTRELPDRTKKKLFYGFEMIMNKFNESESKWGFYNVITAWATHNTKGRGGSNIFSAGYKQMDTIAKELIEYNPSWERKNALEEEAKKVANILEIA
jgi:hypothetical protein